MRQGLGRRRFECVAECGIAALLALGVVGCASTGPPHAPSLHLPRTVTDLQAERVGPSVRLEWTNPEKTTDDELLPGPAVKQKTGAFALPSGPARHVLKGDPALIAEVCREEHGRVAPRPVVAVVSGAFPQGCVTLAHIAVQPGARSTWEDSLSDTLSMGEPRGLAYRVRILNKYGRSAPPSAPVLALAGVAPMPVAQLQARMAPKGVELRWAAPSDPAQESAIDEKTEIVRHRIVPVTEVTASADAKKQKNALSAEPKNDVVMRVSSMSAIVGGEAGTVDATAVEGSAYEYKVQRLRASFVDGQRLEERSTSSTVLSGTLEDRFPPKAPQELEAVPVVMNGKAAVDLSWEPNVESDLAGYRVYRSEDGAAAVRLTGTSLVQSAFHDGAVVLGKKYRYTVTAVDASGNESATSEAADAVVR